jgi:hypothetical protein
VKTQRYSYDFFGVIMNKNYFNHEAYFKSWSRDQREVEVTVRFRVEREEWQGGRYVNKRVYEIEQCPEVKAEYIEEFQEYIVDEDDLTEWKGDIERAISKQADWIIYQGVYA